VAAATHDALIVHGGFNGHEHWGDVWRLDLSSWHWEQLHCQVRVCGCMGVACLRPGCLLVPGSQQPALGAAALSGLAVYVSVGCGVCKTWLPACA